MGLTGGEGWVEGSPPTPPLRPQSREEGGGSGRVQGPWGAWVGTRPRAAAACGRGRRHLWEPECERGAGGRAFPNDLLGPGAEGGRGGYPLAAPKKASG